MSTRLNWVITYKEIEKMRLKTIVARIENERMLLRLVNGKIENERAMLNNPHESQRYSRGNTQA